MSLEYKNKYLKYKNKYLKQKNNLIGGFDETKTYTHVITYNDPYFSGLDDGDVDDIFAIIYLAIKYREKLTIIINDNNNKRSTNTECIIFLQLIKILYNCTIIYDSNIKEIEQFFNRLDDVNLCFICAPMTDNFNLLLNELKLKGIRLIINGTYNFINSVPQSQDTSMLIRISDKTIYESVPINKIDDIYKTNSFFKKCNLYQLKKLFGLMDPSLHDASTVWLGNEEQNNIVLCNNLNDIEKLDIINFIFKGHGHLWGLYKNIISFFGDIEFAHLCHNQLPADLIQAYNNYIHIMINYKKDRISDEELKDVLGYNYKQMIIEKNDICSDYLLNVEGTIDGNSDTICTQYMIDQSLPIKYYIIGSIQHVPDLLNINNDLLKLTPNLSDFNTVYSVLYAIDQELEFSKINTFIKEQKYPIYISDLNNIIRTFNKDTTKLCTLMNDIFM